MDWQNATRKPFCSFLILKILKYDTRPFEKSLTLDHLILL